MPGTKAVAPRPSLPWRITSATVMGLTAAVSRTFLYGLNRVEVVGLPQFLEVLDRRRHRRERGLLTVCNHIGVLDDPLIWGVLPLAYGFDPSNHRWSLGAHDICFPNKFAAAFFSAGQVLPTHRQRHSHHGGLFQPTIAQAIEILSGSSTPDAITEASHSAETSPTTYTTTGSDLFLAPAAYAVNRNAWVHVFPEGCVHQQPDKFMKYFKWGVSRLILESDSAPEFVPMFIDGTHDIMPDDRKWPRFAPRIGATVRVVFGKALDGDEVFGDLREQWKLLSSKYQANTSPASFGHELADELKYGSDAVSLRIEVARRVRDEVQKLRTAHGYPDGDPSLALASTWAEPRKDASGHHPATEGRIEKE